MRAMSQEKTTKEIKSKKQLREEKLAKALRDNLRRRKDISTK